MTPDEGELKQKALDGMMTSMALKRRRSRLDSMNGVKTDQLDEPGTVGTEADELATGG